MSLGAPVPSVEENVCVNERGAAVNNVFEVQWSKKSSSIDSRNCSLVKFSGGAIFGNYEKQDIDDECLYKPMRPVSGPQILA